SPFPSNGESRNKKDDAKQSPFTKGLPRTTMMTILDKRLEEYRQDQESQVQNLNAQLRQAKEQKDEFERKLEEMRKSTAAERVDELGEELEEMRKAAKRREEEFHKLTKQLNHEWYTKTEALQREKISALRNLESVQKSVEQKIADRVQEQLGKAQTAIKGAAARAESEHVSEVARLERLVRTLQAQLHEAKGSKLSSLIMAQSLSPGGGGTSPQGVRGKGVRGQQQHLQPIGEQASIFAGEQIGGSS
ncbi:unnamed protein product, partial [Amoebophrya sp. A25]